MNERLADRGTAAVEFALVLPLLAALFFGAVEYGFAWQSASKVESATAAGARVAAQAGQDPLADWEILQAVRGSLGGQVDDVDRLIVYHSTFSDGRVPAACQTTSAFNNGGVPGVCSVYGGDDLEGLDVATFSSSSSFGGGSGNPCGGGATRGWCPEDRIETGTPLMIGVSIEFTFERVTGFLPGVSEDIANRAVARLEPSS